MEPILDEMYEMRLRSGMEEIVKGDKKYKENEQLIRQKELALEELGLQEEQRECVEEYAKLHIRSNYEYARIAYNCGFEDAMRIVLRLLKRF